MSATEPTILPIADRRTTARRAARLLGQHRLPAVIALLAFSAAGITALVPPWLLGRIVDDVRAGADSDRVVSSASAIAVAAVLTAALTWVAVAALARTGEPALAALREQALDRALHLDAERIERAGSGDVLSRVGDDVRTITRSLNEAIPLLVISALAVAFTGVGLFALDWRLGLAGLVAAPFYLHGLRWYLPRSAPLYRAERIAQGARAQALVDGIQAAPTVRAFGLEHVRLEQVRASSARAVSLAISVFRMLTRFFARNNRAELIGLLAILVTGFFAVRADAVTVGAVTAAALYFHRLFNPIGALLVLFDDLQSTGASLARIVGMTELPLPPAASAPPPPEQAAVTLHNIEHAYVAGRPVLRSGSLQIAPGERVALVGATGAGKTTLGAIAGGVLRPSSGQVCLGGVPYDELGPAAVRRRVSLVSQDVHVFAGTVRESLTLARPEATEEQLRAALQTSLAWPWVHDLPDGLDTVVGEHGHPLTASQAQQLALTRVALADPWVVILDEATAEAGSSGAHLLEQAALAVTQGRAALIVAHRLTQSQAADRVLVLHDGAVVEHGTHAELVAGGGRYAELWQAWSG